jgi:ribonuclease T
VSAMSARFRGYLPVVVDLETGGFSAATDALLEIGVVFLDIDPAGYLSPGRQLVYEVLPFEGARLDPESLAVHGIDPLHPLRPAIPEREALQRLFREVRHALRESGCTRAVLTGHNAAFDLGFLNAAVARADVKRNPFHPFSTFDTVTLAGVFLGQTVLAKAAQALGLEHDSAQAHGAAYDAWITAEIFCQLANRVRDIHREYALLAAVDEAAGGTEE